MSDAPDALPPILPHDGLDLDATEAHCRHGYHVPPATALGLVALVRVRDAEIERLKGLLTDAWDASGLLGSEMTGQPDQACEEPSDLIFQIAELADRASTRDEAEQEAEELRAEVERLKARCAFAVEQWSAMIERLAYDVGHTTETAREVAETDIAAALAEWDCEHPAGTAEDVPAAPDPEPSPRPEPSEPLPSWSDRLRFDHDVSETSPVVTGTWVTVAHVVSLIIDGWSWSDVLRTHPEITEDDLRACLAYTIETDGDKSK